MEKDKDKTQNFLFWDQLKTPPPTALKEIKGGRLKGMSDINPQWRYEAMTETFGPCGIGWKYTVDRLWLEPGSDGQICAFATISLFINNETIVLSDGTVDRNWSDPIPGIGGSMLIEKETRGLHTSDECFKMATTDALSVAMKMLGVASDVYRGNMDGSKYQNTPPQTKKPQQKNQNTTTQTIWTGAQKKQLADLKAEVEQCASPVEVDVWMSDKRNAGLVLKDHVKDALVKHCEEIKGILEANMPQEENSK